jgi:gliding motility-associated transport system ATP-binding protein
LSWILIQLEEAADGMIAVDGVSKHFGELVAVDEVSFEIPRGEVVGFLGPNGAGKTTTMRMLTGTLQPDAGQVLFDGTPIGEDLTGAKERVGYLPESNPLYEEMLVAEYLEFAGKLRNMDGPGVRSAIQDAAEETGLSDVFFRPISQLSKGYRQRVGLAAAILHRPEILILDEPTEGLDPNQRVDIRSLVSALGRERTVLLSTHVMQEVEAVCNRLIIINQGQVIADGTVEHLLASRKGLSHYMVEVVGGDVEPVLAGLPGVQDQTLSTVEGRTRVRLTVAGDTDLRPEIFRVATEKGWVLWELYRERASLEQIFQELTVRPADAVPGEFE